MSTTKADPKIDPRIAATGGTRHGPKDKYHWLGMARHSDWLKTDAHRHTDYYACAKCGQQFKTPNAVYTHLDKVHPKHAPAGGSEAQPAARARRSVRSRGAGRVRRSGVLGARARGAL